MTSSRGATVLLAAAVLSGSISIVPLLPVVLVAGGVYFIATAFLRNRGLRVSGPARWYIAFMVVGLAYATLIGVDVLDPRLYRRELKHFIPFSAFLVFSSLVYTKSTEVALRRTLLGIAFANLLLFAASPILLATGALSWLYPENGDIWTGYGPAAVYLGPFLSHSAGGGWFATAGLVMLGIASRSDLHPKTRTQFRVSGIFYLVLLATTFSRAFLLATAVVLLHVNAQRVFRRGHLKLAAVALIPAALFVFPYLDARIASSSLGTLADAPSTASYNVMTRYVLWGKALEDFVQSPLIGVGVTRFDDELTVIATFPNEVESIFDVEAEPQYFHAPLVRVNIGSTQAHTDQQAHNMYLHALAEGGIMMFFLLLGVLVGTVQWLRRVTVASDGFRGGLANGVLWAIYAVLIAAFFGNSFLTIIPMFFLLSLAGYLNSVHAQSGSP